MVVDDSEEIGELKVAEYIILTLAFSTYVGYVEEQTDAPANDEHTRKGIKLLRLIDSQQGENIQNFLYDHSSRDESKRSIKRTFRVRVSNVEQASRRALTLRTVINRGGAATLKALFQEARPRKGIRSAITASMVEDPATALSQYAAIPLQNVRIKAWVKAAQKLAGSGDVIHNPVEVAADTVADGIEKLRAQQVVEDGSTSVDTLQDSQEAQEDIIAQAQESASEAAREAMELSGEEDVPPNKSEVVGIATAAALAVASEIGNSESIPEPLKKLDPEQRAAALTDGKVLVAAGAGAGKSTTLVARVKYLVEDRGVGPGKILVSSFNKKAAEELKVKIGKAVGGQATNAMTVGTLHGLFLGAIKKYGTPEERAMFQGTASGILSGSTVASAVNRLWRKCFAEDQGGGRMKDADAPKAKSMKMHVTKWAGNGVSVAEAKAKAVSPEEQDAALWYEMYEGLKGALPGWKPQCEGRAEAKGEYDRFVQKHRVRRGENGREYIIRVGDFDDMISVFKDLLERNNDVRSKAQKAFDHILIDECQDLNSVQHRVLELMTGHITDGKDGKSFWMIGDDKQSIYAFRGARPDLFTGLDGKEDWTTRMIRTNYRCPPEVVELANKLIAHNEDQIEMEANAAPSRNRGEASITVQGYGDEAATAIAVASEIKDIWDQETNEISDNAILCRTNNELNSYETALLMRGIPYARKGASSFLSSPETKAFLGYVTLATDSDHEKMQKAFLDVLGKPNRFFASPDKLERAVDYALSNYARSSGQTKKSINPMVALRDPGFQMDLVYILKGTTSGFKARKGFEAVQDMVQALSEIEAVASDEKATTNDLFDAILDTPGVAFDIDPNTGRIRGEKEVSFREELNASLKDYGSEDDDEKEEAGPDGGMNLGNISFLYELAKPDPNDPADAELSPETPKGFWAKMDRLTERASELRIDLDAWEKEQDKLSPEDRKPPPGVYLGTIHCSPPNEPVLTTEGWVEIGDLDPETHKLASYVDSCNQLFWGASGKAFKKGYSFQKESRPYEGDILTLKTEKSSTQITPDHRIRVKLADTFYNKYVVYLMKRGPWWRLGMCKSAQRPYKSGDLSTRLSTEQADAAWILGVFENRTDALLEEARLQTIWGITGLTFEPSGSDRVMTAEQLHEFHADLAQVQGPKAVELLASFGLDAGDPIYYRSSEGRGSGLDKRASFTIRARNFLGGYMSLPVVKDSFVDLEGPRSNWTKPLWLTASVSRKAYSGPVYSLNVVPHRYYVSGGAVVHNSVKGAQWPNVFVQMGRGRFPILSKLPEDASPEQIAAQEDEVLSERRLAYVALTRPSKNLRVVYPAQYQGKAAGPSPFIAEAGLTVGENVGVTEDEALPKTASEWAEDKKPQVEFNWKAEA